MPGEDSPPVSINPMREVQGFEVGVCLLRFGFSESSVLLGLTSQLAFLLYNRVD